MKKYNVEIKFDIEHVPHVLQAEGNDFGELMSNATYNVDCDNPKRYTEIDELPHYLYSRLVEKISAEMSDQDEARRER